VEVAAQTGGAVERDRSEITEAAITGLGRLLRVVKGKLETHPSGDGGLICEYRRSHARPTIWRVSCDGEVLPDSPYSYRHRTFVPAQLPASVQHP